MNVAFKQTAWKVVIVLALINLMRPLMSILGIFENIKPSGPIIATVLITLAWIIIGVLCKLKRPIETLAAAGFFYGIFAVLLPVFMSFSFPETNPQVAPLPGIVSIILMNTVWGGVQGFIVWLFLRQKRK